MSGELWSLIEALSPDERQELLITLHRTVAPATGEAVLPSPAPAFTPAGPAGERFQVLDHIGAGGMGAVYRVRDRTLLRESAMKVLAPNLATQPRYAKRFLGEAQIQAQLEHPNIIPVHELAVGDDGASYFTMRLLRGATLGAWIRQADADKTLTEASYDMLSAFLKVCDAVAFAHDRGVVHGDITAENVVVAGFGAVYLMDWGLSRLIEKHGLDDGGGGAAVTISLEAWNAVSAGEVAGTPAFMSPEQANGQSELIDERTDVFGLGGLLHTILTGRPPHAGRTLAEVRERAKQGAGASAVADAAFVLVGPDGLPLPAGIGKVITRALAINRDERYQNALELKREVEHFLRGGLAWPLRRYAAGTCIVTEGEDGDAAFVVVQGTCVVYKRTVQGGRQVLREVGPGGAFGETAVFSPGPRTATIEARTDVVVRVVTRQVLEEGLGLDSSFGAFVVALAERFRDLDARLSAYEAPPER